MSEFTEAVDNMTLSLTQKYLPVEFSINDLKHLNRLLITVICNLLLSPDYYTTQEVQDFRVSAVEVLNKVIESKEGG